MFWPSCFRLTIFIVLASLSETSFAQYGIFSQAAKNYFGGSVGIGTSSPSAVLDITATGTSSAVVIPRDTTTNRPAAAVNGMIRYNTDANKFEAYENSSWSNMIGAGGGSSQWGTSGSNIYNLNAGNVGIGTTSPQALLDVNGSISASGNGTGVITLNGGTAPGAPAAGSANVFVNSNGMLQCQYDTGANDCIPTYNSGSNQISSDVTMTTINTFYDGPSTSVAAGTWILSSTVTLSTTSTTSAVSFTCKLWDGTSVISSTEMTSGAVGAAAVRNVSLSLQGLANPGSTTTYKVSCTATVASQIFKAATPDNSAGNNASTLIAVRLR